MKMGKKEGLGTILKRQNRQVWLWSVVEGEKKGVTEDTVAHVGRLGKLGHLYREWGIQKETLISG